MPMIQERTYKLETSPEEYAVLSKAIGLSAAGKRVYEELTNCERETLIRLAIELERQR